MTKEDKQTSGGVSFFSTYRSQIIILGVIGIVIVAIYQIFPVFWEDHWIPILFNAFGLGMPALFSLWNYWVGYGWQVGIAPGLTFALMGISTWLFGYDTETLWVDAVFNLFWTNLLVLAIWLILVLFAFRTRPPKETNREYNNQDHKHNNKKSSKQDYRKGEIWQDYRWIIAPAVIILLFLFDTSWAQSTLSTLSLKKSSIKATPQGAFQVHAEYPLQIPFNEAESSEIHLWATGTVNCLNLEISADGLLFAVKPQSEKPLVWNDKLAFNLSKGSNAVTLLVITDEYPTTNSRSVELALNSGGNKLDTSNWAIRIENKQDSQMRGWKKNFLDAGSTIVSLITAVFVVVKQLEEEKKRQKAKQIEQAISDFSVNAKKDFLKTLQKHWDLIADWNEWDRTLPVQFREKHASFMEKDLWDVIANNTLEEVKECVYLFLRIYWKIFEDKEGKPASTINLLHDALQGNIPALLAMLKEYPESISIAKQIARNLPDDLKKEIPKKYKNEFLQEIITLKEDLGFPDPESFPLQSQFRFYTIQSQMESRLAAWLEKHDLRCSPFADSVSPYTSTPRDEKMLIEQVPAGFSLSTFEYSTQNFGFENSWDAGAALFEYAKNLPQKIEDETFVTVLTPAMITNFGMEQPRTLFLHALAEGWLWTLAEAPATYYSLGKSQRALTGRLLRWHGGSPFSIIRSLEKILGREKGEKSTQKFIENMAAWLENMEASDLRKEELPALLELRPSSKQRFTLALVSSADLQSAASAEISPAMHGVLDSESKWLKSHGWALAHFTVSNVNPQQVSEDKLVKQCQDRVRICSDGQVEALESLFAPHPEDPADLILARKAAGSPGKMVRLGYRLLLQHVKSYSPDTLLNIEDLLALE
jgi:hypothetical protein